jgi:hypothetical protein
MVAAFIKARARWPSGSLATLAMEHCFSFLFFVSGNCTFCWPNHADERHVSFIGANEKFIFCRLPFVGQKKT